MQKEHKDKIQKNALFLIDGSYFLYRSYYALPPMTTSSGRPSQATFSFCRTLNKLIHDYAPKHIAVIWDSKGGSHERNEAFPEYKANRQAPPSDLFQQKDDIIEFVNTIEMCNIAQVGYEGDDLIGSIIAHHRGQVVVVTADKDMAQLLSKHDHEKVILFDVFKDRFIDAERFEKDNGFSPEKVTFYYALIGDTSDNIPGVTGVGPKTALELVSQFESLEDLYANLNKVAKPRVRIALEKYKDDAFLSLKLFTIDYKGLTLKAEQTQFDANNWAKAKDFFDKFEFKSLQSDMKKRFPELYEGVSDSTLRCFDPTTPEWLRRAGKLSMSATQGKHPSLSSSGSQQNLFGQTNIFGQVSGNIVEHAHKIDQIQVHAQAHEKTVHEKKWTCTLVTTQEVLRDLIKQIRDAGFCALDTETTGFYPLQDDMVGMSFAVNSKEAFYIPFKHASSQENQVHVQLDRASVLEELRPILESSKIKKILHSVKFDELVLWNQGIALAGVEFDTIIAACLLRKEWDKINLKDLSMQYLHESMLKFKDVLGNKKDFSQVPLEDAAQYGAHDALQTLKLKLVLEKLLEKEPVLEKLFRTIEMPLSAVLVSMEKRGIELDPEVLKTIDTTISRKIKMLEEKIFAALPEKFQKIDGDDLNLNSPKQIETLLFDYLELPQQRKSKTGSRSTDKDVLDELSKIHPIPALILTLRELTKLKTTYLEPLPGFINPKTGRIHTSYSQTMTATGRLSSSNPNLQNIPASVDHGIQIRSAFIAPRGYTFLSADYSQIELRVLAHMSGDKNLIQTFIDGKDIHSSTAAQLFDVELDKVTNDQRKIGKRINFSIIYGLTPYGLAQELDIKPGQAKEYIDKYFAQYPEVAGWMAQAVLEAAQKGYVESLWGRRRWVPQLQEKNRTLAELGKRIAVNSPIQSTQADIIKIAMINIQTLFEKKKLETGLILQIHDELVFEVLNKEMDIVKKIVKEEMENVVHWKVPIIVNLQEGKNWGEITK
ncbi:MAG: DNA polymerase I [bacterium]